MDKIVITIFLLLFNGLSETAAVIPKNVYISMLHTQERQAILSAINQVNADLLLLPNTTLHFVESTFTESNLIETAGNISKNNISSVIFDSKPNESHDAFSYMLNMPLLSTEPFRASPENSSLGDYEISVGPSTISAMVDLIVKYKWINVVVLYDVRWRDHVTKFLSSLPSNAHYLPVEIILDRAGLIDGKSKKKVLFLRNDPAEAVVLLCDGAFSETIIKQIFPLFSYVPKRTHRWLLADPVKSFKMEADSSQVIIGFAPRVYSNAKTTALHTALSTNVSSTKFTSYLVFDAVLAFAHALHGILVDGKWKAMTTGGDLSPFINGDLLVEYMKKVDTVGTTGTLKFTDGGYRQEAVLDVINLRDGTFVKIGEWNDISSLTMTSSPTKNQGFAAVVPLSQLKRKLRVAIVEDSPFVTSRENPTTKKKEFFGFSVDLVKEIAQILNFEYEFYIAPDGRYGGTNPDGTLAGVIGEVYKGNADMSSMPLTINSERLQHITFSKPFMFISMDLIMQRPKAKEFDITGFMTPYTIPVWIMTLVTWLFVTAILSFVNYYSPYGHRLCDEEQNGDEFSWFNSLWFCLACMLQQGGDSTPRMFSGRVVVGFFWFGIIVWVSTYTANLASVLTTSQENNQISSLEEALEKEYHIYVMGGTAFADYLKNSEYRVYRLLWERISTEKTLVDSTREGFNKVRDEHHNVFIEESPFAESFLNKKPCDVMSVKDITGSSSYGIAFAQQNPYVNNISITILKMQERGILDDLRRKWWSIDDDCDEYEKPTAEDVRDLMRIQIENMVGVYIVLAGGGVVGLIFIFFEKWWANRRKKIQEKVRKGWTAVKTTTKLMNLKKKPVDAETVVEAFQVSIPSKNKMRPKIPWDLPSQKSGNNIKDAGETNKGFEDLESNDTSKLRQSPALPRASPWKIPSKRDSTTSQQKPLAFEKRRADSPASIDSQPPIPISSKNSTRVSYVEVVYTNDVPASIDDSLEDLEEPTETKKSSATLTSTSDSVSNETTAGEKGSKTNNNNPKPSDATAPSLKDQAKKKDKKKKKSTTKIEVKPADQK